MKCDARSFAAEAACGGRCCVVGLLSSLQLLFHLLHQLPLSHQLSFLPLHQLLWLWLSL